MNHKLTKLITNIGNPFILIIGLTQLLFFLMGYSDFTTLVEVLGLQIVLPVLLMILFLKLKIVSDFEITKKSERSLYFICLSILFLVSIFISSSSQALLLNTSLFLGVLTILVVSIWWKISGHMILDFICLTCLSLINPLFALLTSFFLLVGYTRIKLEKHTLSQVIVGSIAGILIVLGFLIS